MARKNNQILTLGLIAAGIYLITRKPEANQPPPYYNFPNVPPAPPANTQQWQQWVAVIAQTFGTVSSLWAPGGPFYKQPVTPEQAQQIQFAWDNALFTGGGFGMP